MKILIVGCGSIGERHLKNLTRFAREEILVCDNSIERLNKIEETYGIKTFINYNEALNCKPDIVLVCLPTIFHVPYAFKAVQNNCHVFVEKPISNTLSNVDKLLKLAKKKKRKIYVGFNYRLNPYLKKIKEILIKKQLGKIYSARAYFGSYLPDRHPGQDYRMDYGGKREKGGGVLFDAGSHLVDYLYWFFGDILEVSACINKRSNLKINVEDNVEMILKFRKDLVIDVHLDFLRRPWQHYFEAIGEKSTIVLSFSSEKSKLKIFNVKKQKWEILLSNIDINSMYLEEMKSLLKSMNGKNDLLVNGKDAKYNLDVLNKALKSNRQKKFIKVN